MVEEAPPRLQSPAQRALSGAYSEAPEEEFSEDKLQKHMNLLVRGATVDMEDMDCCESVRFSGEESRTDNTSNGARHMPQ